MCNCNPCTMWGARFLFLYHTKVNFGLKVGVMAGLSIVSTLYPAVAPGTITETRRQTNFSINPKLGWNPPPPPPEFVLFPLIDSVGGLWSVIDALSNCTNRVDKLKYY